MLNNEIRDFAYHEFKTDSDNLVKDLCKVFALGRYSKEVTGKDPKESAPSIEYNWKITCPAPNFNLIERNVSEIEDLDAKEYELITLDQISRMTNRAVVKCNTLSEDKSFAVLKSKFGQDQKERAEIYLEIYMPKFLCDTESDDPFVQEDGVSIPLCVNPKTAKKEAKVRNYHWCLFRLFDTPNEDLSGPLKNKTDMVTGELLEFNSTSSEWTKLSWFTDFEELFLSELIPGTSPSSDKILRVPVNSSLTNKTKVKVMANMHPNRVALTVVGNPNVDYEDNRYLISTAYIGAIDSFKGAKKDIEGNFGIFTTSSSVPAIPSQTIEPTATFSGLNEDADGNVLSEDKKWMIYDQSPNKVTLSNSPEQNLKAFINLGALGDLNLGSVDSTTGALPGEMVFRHTYKKREIPSNPLIDSDGGRTGIVESSMKATLGNVSGNELFFDAIFEYGNNALGCHLNKYVHIKIPASDLKSSMLPINIKFESKEGSLTELVTVTIKNNELYKALYKYIEAELATRNELDALVPKAYTVQRIRFNGVKWTTGDSDGYHANYHSKFTIAQHSCWLGYDEQGAIKKVVNKTERDKYGNLVKINYPKTFGKHTANCTTDFAMYKTDSSDFWQSHFFMFSSTEQFMKKHMYGKSVYTNEYFADRIKITHSAEGVRGVLSGLIVIDAESLFAFDELIVNKDFSKELDKPEETYVYVPITASFCPFANSPNERNGLGLLKEVKYSEHDDEAKCEAALVELAKQYVDSLYYANNKEGIPLANTSHNDLQITWSTSDADVINLNPVDSES